MDVLAKNNRDNVLFSSLLIGLSVNILRGWYVHVRVVCVCACVRLCVCYYKDVYNKNKSLTYFVNILPVI